MAFSVLPSIRAGARGQTTPPLTGRWKISYNESPTLYRPNGSLCT